MCELAPRRPHRANATQVESTHSRQPVCPCGRVRKGWITACRVVPPLVSHQKGRRRACLKTGFARSCSCLRQQSAALPVLSHSRPPWMLLLVLLVKTRATPAGPYFAGSSRPRAQSYCLWWALHTRLPLFSSPVLLVVWLRGTAVPSFVSFLLSACLVCCIRICLVVLGLLAAR